MIKRLRISNYLSLREVDLELGKRNLLIGPNMAGKSNLVDCFKFLTQMCISGLVKAFQDRNGFPEVVWKGGDESRISFRLTGEVSASEKESPRVYDYELSVIGGATGLVSIEREHLIVRAGNETSTLIDLRHGQGKITHANGDTVFKLPSPSQSALEFAVPGWEGTAVKNLISRWHYYHLTPANMKLRSPGPAVAQTFLSESGDNFSSWLMTLQSGFPDEFRLIKRAAMDVFPDLEEILTPPTQFATTYVTTRERHLKQPISIWRMSDGELKFLALLSLIFAPPSLGAPLYCIEEPENHLHPRLLETLVELLTQRQNELGPQAAQIIATTHSPHLVDKVTLDELIVVEKSNGATHFTRPASKEGLRELLEREELGLGDLWYSGALSGN
ncbi:MAG: AAA family ATPase [candidate division NC10 bacterium]|nr:AAA family ATPase [candidate division NC10 bacterium]